MDLKINASSYQWSRGKRVESTKHSRVPSTRRKGGMSRWGENLSSPLSSSQTFSYPWCFLRGSAGKESTCKVGDLSSIPGLGRSPGKGNDNPLQYSCLENPTDGSLAGHVHGVLKSQTRLSEWLSLSFILLYMTCLSSLWSFLRVSIKNCWT